MNTQLLVTRLSALQARFDVMSNCFKAEAEVKRLDQLKASKMKELFIKKQFELEEICNTSHMQIPSRSEMDNIINLINSGRCIIYILHHIILFSYVLWSLRIDQCLQIGEIDHADLLMSMDDQISKAKDEAFSRKVIMEKVEKWMSAREEERWLEEYSMVNFFYELIYRFVYSELSYIHYIFSKL